MKMKIRMIHFAWDRYEDGKYVKPKLEEFKRITNWKKQKVSVYVLTNYDTTIDQDIERVMYVRSLGFQPYVMRYNKDQIKRGSMINALARWVNMPAVFWKYNTFEEYLEDQKKTSF